MRNIIKAVIVIGSVAAAITGTTVAVKKNKKAAAWYEKFMPAFGKKSCKAVETKVNSVDSYIATGRKTWDFLKSECKAAKTRRQQQEAK